jgi:succinate-acetate transporter protein
MAERVEERQPPVATPTTDVNLIADPAPLGLGGFAATTFVLSLVNAGVMPAEAEPVVLPLALFYGGIAQIFAGLWEFRNARNTFGATAFTSYGAFWLTFYLLVNTFIGRIPEEHHPIAVGTYLLAWTVFTFYMWIASFRLNTALVGIFSFLLATFAVLAIGAYTGATGITRIGGWLGVITAILAWYLAAAVVINSTNKRVVLPVGPRS